MLIKFKFTLYPAFLKWVLGLCENLLHWFEVFYNYCKIFNLEWEQLALESKNSFTMQVKLYNNNNYVFD